MDLVTHFFSTFQQVCCIIGIITTAVRVYFFTIKSTTWFTIENVFLTTNGSYSNPSYIKYYLFIKNFFLCSLPNLSLNRFKEWFSATLKMIKVFCIFAFFLQFEPVAMNETKKYFTLALIPVQTVICRRFFRQNIVVKCEESDVKRKS